MEQHITELAMLLIYLTGWEEDKRNRRSAKKVGSGKSEKIFRSWIGYKYEIIEELQSKGLIHQIPGGKSLIVTDNGKQKAEELKKKFGRKGIEI